MSRIFNSLRRSVTSKQWLIKGSKWYFDEQLWVYRNVFMMVELFVAKTIHINIYIVWMSRLVTCKLKTKAWITYVSSSPGLPNKLETSTRFVHGAIFEFYHTLGTEQPELPSFALTRSKSHIWEIDICFSPVISTDTGGRVEPSICANLAAFYLNIRHIPSKLRLRPTRERKYDNENWVLRRIEQIPGKVE